MSSNSSQSRLKKYRKCKYLGKGSYGAAILVELKANTNQKFVVKEIVIGHLKKDEQDVAKKEADVLHKMSHSNITMYIESFVEGSKLYIVMEHADGGDLSSLIANKRKSGSKWSEEEVMRMFVQICLALNHVHEKNILHRDLKSQNIFLTTKGLVKLGDFGIAKVLDATDGQAQTQIGTPYYLSPEICDSKPYGRKSDVWSLGVILFELISLELPFQANSLPALIVKICTGHPAWEKIETSNYSHSHFLIELTKSMLVKDPDQRPFVMDMVKSEYVKGHISRLLSYTLKMGNGGAMIQRQQSELTNPSKAQPTLVPDRSAGENGQDAISNKSSEEMEIAIEHERRRARQAEQQRVDEETRLKQQRAKDREKELNKLKQFKREMMMAKRKDEQDVDNVVLVKGRDGGAALADMRARDLEQQEIQRERVREREKRQPRSLADIRRERDNQSELEGLRKFKQDVLRRQNEESERREQLQQRQQQQIVRQDNPCDYESIARQEYFKNREAARKIKEKVQALERQSDSYHPSANEHQDLSCNDDYGGIGARFNRGGVREMSAEERQKEGVGGIEGMRARKDREREVINEEYERKLQEAYQMNREAQKKLKHKIMQQEMDGDDTRRQGAVAFDINFDDDNRKIRGGGKPMGNPPKDVGEKSTVQRQRKGWGPRNAEIKIVNNSKPSQMQASNHESKQSDVTKCDIGERLEKVDDVFRSSLSSSSSMTQPMKRSEEDTENLQDVKMNEDNVRASFQRDNSNVNDNYDSNGVIESDVEDNAAGLDVMQAVRERQRAKEDQKRHAKVLLSQLKDRRVQNIRNRGGGAVSMGSRLGEVLGSVDKAQAVVREMISKKVQSPIRNQPDKPKGPSEDSKMESNKDAKEDRIDNSNCDVNDKHGNMTSHNAEEKIIDGTEGAEAELERTLDGWLKRQEQNVTVRCRPKSAKDVEDGVYSSTMTMQESKETMFSETKDQIMDGMNDTEDDNDGDISDLQCVLASALLE